MAKEMAALPPWDRILSSWILISMQAEIQPGLTSFPSADFE
jgi:hypothetical protein